MQSLSRIVLMIERGDRVHAALGKALSLARHTGAQLDLLLCDTEAYRQGRSHTPANVEQPEPVRRGREYLRALREAIIAPDVQIDSEVCIAPSPVEGLAQKLQRRPAEIVVRAFGRAHTATAAFAHQVLRQTGTALLLTCGRPWLATPQFVGVLHTGGPCGANRPLERLTELLKRCCGAQVEYLVAAPEHTPEVIADRQYDLVALALPSAESVAVQQPRTERLLQASSADLLMVGSECVANTNGRKRLRALGSTGQNFS